MVDRSEKVVEAVAIMALALAVCSNTIKRLNLEKRGNILAWVVGSGLVMGGGYVWVYRPNWLFKPAQEQNAPKTT